MGLRSEARSKDRLFLQKEPQPFQCSPMHSFVLSCATQAKASIITSRIGNSSPRTSFKMASHVVSVVTFIPVQLVAYAPAI